MKHIFTLLIFLIIASSSNLISQKNTNVLEISKTMKQERLDSYRSGLLEFKDTLIPPIFLEDCAESVFSFLNSGGWGFVAGMNSFGDLEKAQRFKYDDASAYKVLEIGVFFAEKKVVTDGILQVKIYAANGENNGPGELLGTSNPINTSEVNVDEESLAITTFTFDTPPMVSNHQFFASVDFSQLYAANDTLSMFMSDIDCGDGADSWELFSNNITWAPINDPDLSWEINANFLMTAIIEIEETTSVKEQNNPLGLKSYPVPAKDQLNLTYQLTESSPTTIEIYSITGKKVLSVYKENQSAGEHIESINTSSFEPGSYFARIRSFQGISATRIIVYK